ncbi:MAG TPA: hypothetical protein VMU65_00490 [Candidatus Saccharimonadales bacterium]|nr:hypothetical protein [Candidatus Saccharimonadales bacterium]
MPGFAFWAAAIVFAAGIVVAHRVDAFTNPQFYAEDGSRWFSDAYNVGAIRALGLSWAGYLQVLSRIGPLVATPFGVANQPLIYNVCGLLLQIAPGLFFLSRRFDTVVPSFWIRIAFSAMYLLLPVAELDVTITGAQFHLVILATLVIVAPDPRRWYWTTFDLVAVLLCGFSGPFVYILLPVSLVWYLMRRRRFTLILSAILAIALVAQIYTRQFSPRIALELGANVKDLALIICDRIVLAGLFAEPARRHVYVAGQPFGVLIASIVCVSALLIVVYAAWKAPWELRIFALVSFGIVAAALVSPLALPRGSQWHALAMTESGSRYFFMARVAWLVILVWAVSTLPRFWMRRTVWVGGTLAFMSGLPTWGDAPYVNEHWPDEARTIVTAAPGTRLLLPVPPGGQWVIDITAKR